MTIAEMQAEIIRIKKEKNICILAHAYQGHEIWEVADYVGDSFGLSEQAAKSEADTILMCGVRFMAETVKILSPQKKVILSNPDAGCPMAEQMDIDLIRQMKEMYPDYAVVCYINTTSELKTVCDVCVTSSSAPKIIKAMKEQKILFIPDCNLGDYIAKQAPEKEIRLVQGGCPTHVRITVKDVEKARAAHPDGLLLVHPECQPKVTALADFAGSTTQIISYAEQSDRHTFIIGTENSIVQHLQMSCPDKLFIPLSKDCVCHNMALTTLADVYHCVCGTFGEVIEMDEETRLGAKRCIDRMLELG